MAEIKDDFGRVNNFADAAFDSIKKILTAAVGDAVKFADERSKKETRSTEDLNKSQEKLIDAVSEFDKSITDQIKSFEKLVKEIETTVRAVESQKEGQGKKKSQDDFKTIAQEQLRVLNTILSNQRKAQAAKVASFTAATPISAPRQAGGDFRGPSVSDAAVRRSYRRQDKVEKLSNYAKGLVSLINNVFGQLDKRDTVLAGLQKGEYVIRERAARVLGKRTLDRMNNADRLPKHYRGGTVKGYAEGGGPGVPPPATGTRSVAGWVRRRLSGESVTLPTINEDPQTRADYEDVGSRLADYLGFSFKSRWRKQAAAWLTSVSSMMLGGQADFFKVLFGGSVTDITNFRRELRGLAFEIEGITASSGDFQKQFTDVGKSINETGKALDAVYKAYLQNSKKGFKSQKDGLRVIKSGLYLSTMIGSSTESTAEMFSDWYRTLNLSADQMGRLARESRYVAMSTGVTGDELLGAMKSSENILKNLKNQGNLTTSAARNVIEMMAQAKKLGIEDQAGKVLGALSGTTSLINADPKMKGFILAMTNRMGRGATQSALNGTFMQDRNNLGRFANEMDSLVRQLTGGRASGVQDMDKLDAQTRMRLSIQLQGLTGMEIDEFKRTQEIFKNSSQTLGDKLGSLEKQINKRTSTESEKLKATQQKQLLLLNASAGFLSSLSDAANREENKNMGEAVRDAMSKMSADEVKDLDQLIGQLDASTMAKIEGFKGDEKKFLAAGLLSAQKLKEAAKQQGLSVKDFGPDLIDAMQKGDMTRLRSVSEELNQASQRLDVEMKMATDPITKLAFTLNQYNETIRTFTSKFVGGIIDLLGPMNLLAIQIGLLATAMYSTFGKDILNRFGFDSLFRLGDFTRRTPAKNVGLNLYDKILWRWKKVLRFFDKGLGNMGRKIGEFFSKGKFLPRAFRNTYWYSRSMHGVFSSLLRGMGAQIRALFNGVVSLLTGGFNYLVMPIYRVFERLFQRIASIIPTDARFIQRSLNPLSRGLGNFTTGISGLAGRIGQAISDLLSYVSDWNGWARWFRGLFDWRAWATWLYNLPSRIINAINSIFSSIVHGVGSLLSGTGRLVEGGVTGFFKKLGWAVEKGFDILRAPLKAARAMPGLNLIVAVIDGLIGAVTGFMSAGETFKVFAEDAALGYGKVTAGMYAASTVGGALAGILDGMTFGILSLVGLRKPIEQFLSYLVFGIMDSLYEFGKGIYDAFDISWLMSQFGELGAQITSLVNSIFGSNFTSMGEMFASLMKNLKPFFYMLGKVVGFLASAIVNIFGGAFVGVLKTIVAIIQGINALVQGVIWFFSDQGSWQGLFDGIYNNMKWVWDGIVSWASGLGNTLYEGMVKALQDVWTWFTSWSKDGRTDEQKASYDRLQTLYAQKRALGPAEQRWYEISNQRALKAQRELPALDAEISRLEQTAVAPGMLWGSQTKTIAEQNGTVQPQGTVKANESLKKSQTVGKSDFSNERLVSTQNEMIDQGEKSLNYGKIMSDTLEMGAQPGSMFVHDIHAESLLLEILRVQKRIAGESLDAQTIEDYVKTLETIKDNPEKGAELALKKYRANNIEKQLEEKKSHWLPDWLWPWAEDQKKLSEELERHREELGIPTPTTPPASTTIPDDVRAWGGAPPLSSARPGSTVVAKTDFNADHMVSTQNEMVGQGELSLKQGEIMAKTLKMGQQVGSMYVHDVHCEALLYMILEQLKGNDPDLATYKSVRAMLIDDPEKAIEKAMEKAAKPTETTVVAPEPPKTTTPAEAQPKPPAAAAPAPAETKPKPPASAPKTETQPILPPATASKVEERVSAAVADSVSPVLSTVTSAALEDAHRKIVASQADKKNAERELQKATDDATKKTIEEKIKLHSDSLSKAQKLQEQEIKALSEGLSKEYDLQTMTDNAGRTYLSKKKKAEEIRIKSGSEDVTAAYKDQEALRRKWQGLVDAKKAGASWGTDLSFEKWIEQYHQTRGKGYLEAQKELAARTLPTDMMDDETYLAWQEHMTKKMLKEQKDNLYSTTEDEALRQGMAVGTDPIFSDKFKKEYGIDELVKAKDRIQEHSVEGVVGGKQNVVLSDRITDALERERLDLERLQREKAALGPATRTWGEFLTFQDKERAKIAERELPKYERKIQEIQRRRAIKGYLSGDRTDLIPSSYYIGWEQEQGARPPGTRVWMPGQYDGPDGAGLHYRLNRDSLPGPVSPDGVQLERKTSAAAEASTLYHSTPVGHHAVPVSKEEDVSAVQPVHLRDITESILRDKTSAQAGNNKLQSDELARIEQASDQQVNELEQIKEGIREMVSLLRPRGANVAGSSDQEQGRTRDPRRPLHAAQFGKMKYGKPGGLANRALINNGEV